MHGSPFLLPARVQAHGEGLMAFIGGSAAGGCSLLVAKENQKTTSDFDALDPRIKGCSPLIIPKKFGSIQKIQAASLKDFLCSADL